MPIKTNDKVALMISAKGMIQWSEPKAYAGKAETFILLPSTYLLCHFVNYLGIVAILYKYYFHLWVQ